MKLFMHGLNGNGNILRERLTKIAKADDPLSMREEVGLMSSVMMDRTKKYAEALEADAENGGHDVGGKVTLAGALLSEHAKSLIEAKEKVAKTEVIRDEHITREMVLIWARQICDAAFRLFGDTDKAHAFVAEVNGSILGTNTSRDISEDDIHELMMSTVPAIDVDSAFIEKDDIS